MRYIGGKSLLLEKISDVIETNIPEVTSVVDLFSGSSIVSGYFKTKGYRIISNDYLYFCYVLTRAATVLNRKPLFRKLGISDPISYLNNLSLKDTDIDIESCFIYNNYSPVGNCERMYFQPDNALKIDIIRLTIEKWRKNGRISENEYYYLLAALINAVPFVANITGVYAAYLKYWDVRTYKILTLVAPDIISNGKKNECYNKDYTSLLSKECDLMYADPPYNSREYLPNYHILETIAKYDYPNIHGVTGMREYEGQKSVFCKKNTVADAFETMIRDCKSKYILISYNNEALLSTSALISICQKYAIDDSFNLFEFDYRRYKNKIPNNASGLKEQLYLLRRN